MPRLNLQLHAAAADAIFRILAAGSLGVSKYFDLRQQFMSMQHNGLTTSHNPHQILNCTARVSSLEIAFNSVAN